MANSAPPGPANPHHHHHHRRRKHTAQVPPKPPIPARTPGPQGHNDHASPLLTTLLGYTPNLTGVRDWADHTLQEVEHLWHKALGGIGIEKETGAPIAHGAPPITAKADELTLEEAHMLALKITTVFEGTGGKSMDYVALAGNFDKMGTSFGLVQWNFGTGTLERLLNKFQAADQAAFDGCFPAEAKLDVLKAALTAKKWDDQKTWALNLFKTPEGERAWRKSFENLGAVDKFKKIQVDDAINWYNPVVEKDIKFLRTLAPALMAKVEFRSYAAMFDCSIQQGGMKKAYDAIKSKVASDKPDTQFKLMTLALTARANAANESSVADCLNRRMSILNGKRTSFTAFGKTRNRDNSQYGIVLTEGTKTVIGL
jgi:hypothetical protein